MGGQAYLGRTWLHIGVSPPGPALDSRQGYLTSAFSLSFHSCKMGLVTGSQMVEGALHETVHHVHSVWRAVGSPSLTDSCYHWPGLLGLCVSWVSSTGTGSPWPTLPSSWSLGWGCQ